MTKNKDQLYRFHWRDGTVNEGAGKSVADAFTRLGFSAGAFPALDRHEVVSPVATEAA